MGELRTGASGFIFGGGVRDRVSPKGHAAIFSSKVGMLLGRTSRVLEYTIYI